MKALALLAVSVGWCWDRFTLRDPWSGVNPATKAERDLLSGRWS
jgi:hypothetical protein